jgi:hypothetical protein
MVKVFFHRPGGHPELRLHLMRRKPRVFRVKYVRVLNHIFVFFYYDNFEIFNHDEFTKISQVLSRFMTKSINCHYIMGLVSIVAYP